MKTSPDRSRGWRRKGAITSESWAAPSYDSLPVRRGQFNSASHHQFNHCFAPRQASRARHGVSTSWWPPLVTNVTVCRRQSARTCRCLRN